MKIFFIAGARPNFMKVAPLIRELQGPAGPARPGADWRLIHTGQHYDYKMSEVFFSELDIPEPDYFLNAGSGSHAGQTAKVMVGFERVCTDERPDIVVVVGDVNSTLACSIVAKKLNIRVAHVEAGLRSRDMAMPEEINRIVTDSISDYLFVSEKSGLDNLKKEGKGEGEVFFAGNVMIDTLFYALEKIKSERGHEDRMGKRPSNEDYAVVTLHRPSNVDDRDRLTDILGALNEIAADMDVFLPLHPRTEGNIKKFGLERMTKNTRLKVAPPMSYLDFLSLWKGAALVLTDSGGIQEETTALGVPCFTIRENTERPVTVLEGTNTLVGGGGEGILRAYSDFKKGIRKKGRVPDLWDGKAAGRIMKVLLNGR